MQLSDASAVKFGTKKTFLFQIESFSSHRIAFFAIFRQLKNVGLRLVVGFSQFSSAHSPTQTLAHVLFSIEINILKYIKLN